MFSVASLLCGIAHSLSFLVISRILQGTGAALLVANSLSLIQGIFSQPAERAKAFGIWGGVGGIAIAMGPVAGGILISRFGWQAAFFLNIPVGVLSLGMALKYLPEIATVPRKINPLAQLLIAVALASLAWAFITAGYDGWLSATVIISDLLCIAAITGFIFYEITSEIPLLPRGIFRIKKFAAATSIGLIINSGFYGQLFIISLYFQQIKYYTTLHSGLALLPQAIIMAATAFCCGRIIARSGNPGAGRTVGFIYRIVMAIADTDKQFVYRRDDPHASDRGGNVINRSGHCCSLYG